MVRTKHGRLVPVPSQRVLMMRREKGDCGWNGKRYNGDMRAVAEDVVSEVFIARA